jgi:hypothetical protein
MRDNNNIIYCKQYNSYLTNKNKQTNIINNNNNNKLLNQTVYIIILYNNIIYIE